MSVTIKTRVQNALRDVRCLIREARKDPLGVKTNVLTQNARIAIPGFSCELEFEIRYNKAIIPRTGHLLLISDLLDYADMHGWLHLYCLLSDQMVRAACSTNVGSMLEIEATVNGMLSYLQALAKL